MIGSRFGRNRLGTVRLGADPGPAPSPLLPPGPAPSPSPFLPPVPPGIASAETDEAAYDAMVALLIATGQWVAVRHTTADDIAFTSSEETPFAALVHVTAEDAPTWDDGAYLRTVSYSLVLVVRGEDPAARTAQLSRLEAIARNTLSGKGYGFCLYAKSTLGRAAHPRPSHPEQRSVIAGRFCYLVEGYGARDESITYQS